MSYESLNLDDFLTLSEQVWPIQKSGIWGAVKANPACPSAADLTHFGALVEREVLRRQQQQTAEDACIQGLRNVIAEDTKNA